jgi:hypothetical protein
LFVSNIRILEGVGSIAKFGLTSIVVKIRKNPCSRKNP